jgi:hypothetical protein
LVDVTTIAGSTRTVHSKSWGEIVLDHVTNDFGNGVVAVDDAVLTIGEGESIVLVAPSGSASPTASGCGDCRTA